MRVKEAHEILSRMMDSALGEMEMHTQFGSVDRIRTWISGVGNGAASTASKLRDGATFVFVQVKEPK